MQFFLLCFFAIIFLLHCNVNRSQPFFRDVEKEEQWRDAVEIVVKIKAPNEAARATVEKLRVEIRSKMFFSTLDSLLNANGGGWKVT